MAIEAEHAELFGGSLAPLHYLVEGRTDLVGA